MNRGEVVFEVARSLGLDDTPVGTDNAADELILMQRWVNRAITDVLVKTRCRLDEADMTLAAGVTNYRIDDDILAVDEISAPDATGMPYMLMEVPNQTITEILYRDAPQVPGTPSHYYCKGDYLRVAPSPTAGVVLHYFYVPRPTPIPPDGTTTNDSADLADPTYGGIPSEFHDAIVMYLLWEGSQYDDRGGGFYRGHAFAPGVAFLNAYLDRIKEIRKELRGKAARGMHMARVGYPDRRGPGFRNDQWPSPLTGRN